MKNTFVASYQPYLHSAALEITDLNVCGAFTKNKNHKKNMDESITFYEYFKLVRYPFSIEIEHKPTQDEIINARALFIKKGFHNLAVTMLDRNEYSAGCLSRNERESIVEEYIICSLRLIKKYKINFILFEEVPHQCFDFVFYSIAKCLEILIFMPIRTLPKSGFMVSTDWEGKNLLPSSYYSYRSSSLTLKQYLFKFDQDYSQYAKEMFFDAPDTLKLYDRTAEYERKEKNLFKRANKLKNVIYKILKIQTILFLLFKYDYPLSSSKGLYLNYRLNIFQHWLIKKRTKSRKYKLLSLYESFSSKIGEIKLEKYRKIIFVALQYQPEASTMPKGGVFNDQEFLIKWLAHKMPEDLILVKEHPNQFSTVYARNPETFRHENYYKNIALLSNVKLISIEENSYSAIEISDVVISVGGTICIEALLKGKDTLCLGNSFFSNLGSVRNVKNYQDLNESIQAIPKMQKARFIEDFCSLERFIYPGSVGGEGTLSAAGISKEENIEIYKNAISDFLNSWNNEFYQYET